VTAFDVHKTLQHLLHLQTRKPGEVWRNNEGKQGKQQQSQQQEAFSLLTNEIPKDRTCSRAGIPDAFCSCYRRVEVDADSSTVTVLATALLTKINRVLKADVADICESWKLKRVVKAKKISGQKLFVVQVMAEVVEVGRGGGGGKEDDIDGEVEEDADGWMDKASLDMKEREERKRVTTGTFEGWVRVKPRGDERESDGGIDVEVDGGDFNNNKNEDLGIDRFEVEFKTISRLDRYGNTSECVTKRKPSIKHLCYCKKKKYDE